MALSNYDTLVIDEKGKSINGVFVSPLGVRVEFYKNWLYVQDERAWQAGGAHVKPTVMEVREGDIKYKDVQILAFRGPQNGIYAVVWNWDHKKDVTSGMIGCGVYAYSGKKFVGVRKQSARWLRKKLNETYTYSMLMPVLSKRKGTTYDMKQKDCTAPLYDVPKEFQGKGLEQGLRFNQGDAYFARASGRSTPASKCGEPSTPILTQMLKADST
jgi:hypothetical protein